jgi:hypothetical protein
MSDTKRLLITASLNIGSSVGEINNAIKKIQRHPSLQKIKIKIDVDQKILKTLTDFNNNLTKINQTMGKQVSQTNDSTVATKKETEAIIHQNQVLEKNDVMRKKINHSKDKSTGAKKQMIETTTGNKFANRTDYSAMIGDSPVSNTDNYVENFNPKALEEARNNLNRFTENSNSRLKELRKNIGNLNPEIKNLKTELGKLNENSDKTDFARVDDKIKSLEKFAKVEVDARKKVDDALRDIGKNTKQDQINDIQKRSEASQKAQIKEYEDGVKLANQMADGKNKEQEKFAKMEAKAQENRIKAAHRMAIAENKEIDRVSNAREKLEQGKDSWWQKALYDREQKEIVSAQTVKDAREKLEQDTNDRWLKNLHDRDQKEATLNSKRIHDIDRAHHDAFLEKEKRESHLGNKLIQDRVRAFDLATKQDEEFNQKRFINEQKFSRMQQDTINRIELSRSKFGHHSGMHEKHDGLLFSANNAKDLDALKNMQPEIAKATTGFKALRHESIGFIDGFKTAMVKFPINYLGGSKTSLIVWNTLRVSTLQHKDEISLFANA